MALHVEGVVDGEPPLWVDSVGKLVCCAGLSLRRVTTDERSQTDS